MEMVERDNLYPLLFDPIYHEKMWGGNMMPEKLGRKLPKTKDPVGESWEVSDRDDAMSIISNGPLKGCTFRQFLDHYGNDIIGKNFQGGRFPLLVKIIDAGKRLSLQVHPDQAACNQLGGGAEPKTEMWYVIAAKKGAKIMAGLKPTATRMQFVDKIKSPDVESCLQIFDSNPGDAYFISSGRLHAIGAGNLLLEIQQSSDTTYRVSDWGRTGSDGKPRQLHVEQAMKSINFMDRTSPRISGAADSAEHNRKYPLINMCPFFQVDELRLVDTWLDNTTANGSFHLLTAINHPVTAGRDDLTAEIQPGCTCFIPASFGQYQVRGKKGEESMVVRTML